MFSIGKKEKGYIGLSVGKSKKVCGYEIKKMPIGAYLRALEKVNNLPTDFMEKFFPGKSLDDLLKELSEIDKDGVQALVTAVFVAAPKYILGLISELSGIDEAELEGNPDIGLDGLIEIVTTVIEVNRLGESLANLKSLIDIIRTR